jgi:hypothetical protein
VECVSGHYRATAAALARHAGGDQSSPKPAIVVAFIFVFDTFKAFLAFILAPLAGQVGQKQLPTTAFAQHAAGDQGLHEAAVAAFAVFSLKLFAFIVPFGAALTDKVGKEHFAATALAQHAAGDHCLDELAVAAFAVFLSKLLAFRFDVVITFATLAQQVGKQELAAPTFAQHAAGYQQADDIAVLVAFVFYFIAVVVFAACFPFFAEQAGQQKPTGAPFA